MVSQLSLRLSRSSSLPDTASSASGSVTGSGLTGYSADREGEAGSPPGYIGFHPRNRRRHHGEQESNKRRRLDEQNYAAATAKDCLVKAGLPLPKVHSDRPRAISLGNVDTSKVELLHHGAKTFPTASSSTSYNYSTDFGKAYKDMVDICRFAYDVPRKATQRDTDTSSTSSFSDTESEDSLTFSQSILSVLSARLDDGLKASRSSTLAKTALPASHLVSCPSSSSICFEEALTVCPEARLMMLSSAPYSIIHSNAAFSRLTGLAPSETVGKSFANLIQVESSSEDEPLSLPKCAVQSGSGSDVIIHLSEENGKEKASSERDCMATTKYTMKVKPVVAGFSKRADCREGGHAAMGVNDITHFAIDLTAIHDEAEVSYVGRGHARCTPPMPAIVMG